MRVLTCLKMVAHKVASFSKLAVWSGERGEVSRGSTKEISLSEGSEIGPEDGGEERGGIIALSRVP
jgi:hypothetical protein